MRTSLKKYFTTLKLSHCERKKESGHLGCGFATLSDNKKILERIRKDNIKRELLDYLNLTLRNSLLIP